GGVAAGDDGDRIACYSERVIGRGRLTTLGPPSWASAPSGWRPGEAVTPESFRRPGPRGRVAGVAGANTITRRGRSDSRVLCSFHRANRVRWPAIVERPGSLCRRAVPRCPSERERRGGVLAAYRRSEGTDRASAPPFPTVAKARHRLHQGDNA